jgi:hypothetical protein
MEGSDVDEKRKEAAKPRRVICGSKLNARQNREQRLSRVFVDFSHRQDYKKELLYRGMFYTYGFSVMIAFGT